MGKSAKKVATGVIGGPMAATGLIGGEALKKFGGGSSPQQQTTTNSPFFANQATQLADVTTQNALNNPAYTGSRHASLTERQGESLDRIRRDVEGGNPNVDAALGLNQQTLAGDFLGPNPHLSAALAPIREEFQRTIAPSIDAAAVGAGRVGSGRHQSMQDSAQQQLADTMGRVAFDNYNAERGRQMQATAQAPGLGQARFGDEQMLLNSQQMLRDDRQGKLDDRARIFYERQQAPMQGLSAVTGTGGGTTTSPLYQQSKLSSALGGGLAGAGVGASVGGPWGAAIGGGLGALGGIFG